MDPVFEIKARLPIDELVSQYCQLKKKGRGFVCLCPFHNDTHPSMQVSPDKGIAYCFACQSGGDIFSFYQAIEKVDFRQALKDLAERTGVKIETVPVMSQEKKDEKERARACLEAALKFYKENLKRHGGAQTYLKERGVPSEQIETFELGVAPDSFSDTYQHLLKEGFSRREILDAGLGVQKDLKDEKIYDRFRNRLMFPIHDAQGSIVGFGGRTLGEDDAKYINSAEGPLYLKSTILYGLDHARETMRETKKAILVEGYFDVLACHRVGVRSAVAVSGTALTEQHVKILKRHVETVILCLDQDRAGREAAERSFVLCAEENLPVRMVTFSEKDPADVALSAPATLKSTLEAGGVPYIDFVLEELGAGDLQSIDGKRSALVRLLPLLTALQSAVEREHYLKQAARLFGTTEATLREDMARLPKLTLRPMESPEPAQEGKRPFSSTEIALGLLLLYPTHRAIIDQLIEPADGFPADLYAAIKENASADLAPENLSIPETHRERLGILLLFLEHGGLTDWSGNIAEREIRKNCRHANHEVLRRKQREIAEKMLSAQRQGKVAEQAQLSNQYQQILKLAKMSV